MDEKYIKLLKTLAQTTAVTAEQVMDYDHEKGDEKGWETAKTMRDDFQELADRIGPEYNMDKNDAARLLVASVIQVNQMQNRIDALKLAMKGYNDDLMPKLQKVVDAKTNEEASKLIEENFIIENNE